jgi:uncharacterized protein GlcG (DUF336 family)
MSRISLEQASSVISGAFAQGRTMGLKKTLSVAVIDAGGHVIAFQRQDRASTMRYKISMPKACGALGLGVSSRKIAEMADEPPTFVASLGLISKAGVVTAAGGVIFQDAQGLAIGAVGITGNTYDNDEACALAGILAAGLKAQG